MNIMNIRNRRKWQRRFRIYRTYFLGFGFIAYVMVLTLTINLVKFLLPKSADVDIVAETESSYDSDTLLLSAFPLSLQYLSENKKIEIVKNDNDIVALNYESELESGLEAESELASELEAESELASEFEVESESESESKLESEFESESESEFESELPEYDEELEYNLAKVIDAEGSILDDYCQQLIAYCFLNRMLLDCFPDTFWEVLFDESCGKAYGPETCKKVPNPDVIPSERALANSRICLENYYAGTMPVPFNLVFQSFSIQGTIYYYDEEHGVYFCLSDRLTENE